MRVSGSEWRWISMTVLEYRCRERSRAPVRMVRAILRAADTACQGWASAPARMSACRAERERPICKVIAKRVLCCEVPDAAGDFLVGSSGGAVG